MTERARGRCIDAETLDRHLDGELDAPEVERVRAHLASCADCLEALRAHERFRAATQVALREAVDLGRLEAGLESSLRRARERERWRVRWPFRVALAAAAAAALLIPAWVLGELKLVPGMPALPLRIDTGLYRNVGIMHYFCGIRRQVPAPPTRVAAAAKLERYTPLLDEIPYRAEGLELVDAHVCTFRQRGYAHLVLRRDGHVVSVFVSRDAAGFVPPLGEAWRPPGDDLALRRLARGRFTFEMVRVGAYFGFVVSDLAPDEERRLAGAFAPGLDRVLERISRVPPSRDRI